MKRNKNSRSNLNRNVVSPDYFVGEFWFTPNAVATGVEITEIKSIGSDNSTDETLRHDNHSWSYANNTGERFNPNPEQNETFGETSQNQNTNVNSSKTSYCFSQDYENDPNTYQVGPGYNFFTVSNRPILDSESSEYDNHDQYDEIEIFEYDDNGTAKNVHRDNHFYSSKQAQHATSYINNKIIPEIFELDVPVNMNKDFKAVKFRKNCVNGNRAATPMPPTFIPKLDLAQMPTLSTVSEITEPNKEIKVHSESEKSYKDTSFRLKPNDENRLSYLNWLGLSPREKRDKFKRQRKLKRPRHLEVSTKESKTDIFFDALNHICETEVFTVGNCITDKDKTDLSLLAKSSRSKLEETETPNKTYIVHKREMKTVASGRSPRVERYQSRFTEYGDEYDHNKSTQVTAEDIDRSYARFVSRSSSSTDFTERRSWIRRILICFLCYK